MLARPDGQTLTLDELELRDMLVVMLSAGMLWVRSSLSGALLSGEDVAVNLNPVDGIVLEPDLVEEAERMDTLIRQSEERRASPGTPGA